MTAGHGLGNNKYSREDCTNGYIKILAAQNIYGGVWSYGGHHDPNNWGAFSNYYHRSRSHWSNVVRASYSEKGPNATSYAFINTSVGEVAYFYCGVK